METHLKDAVIISPCSTIRMLGVLVDMGPGEITPSEPDLGNASEGKR